MDAVAVLVQEGRLLSFSGRPDQQEEPTGLLTGLRIMLGGHARDPAVERMLERLRESV